VTPSERSDVRAALTQQGFRRKSYTDSARDGSYSETWTHSDGSEIILSWPPVRRTVQPRDVPRDKAIRGLLQEGKRYLYVNGDGRFAREIRLTGPIHLTQNPEDVHPVARVPHTGRDPRWGPGFAGDMGLWDVPGVKYKNLVNFVLDIDALAAEGIYLEGVEYP
jgi:hypothetical protein